MWVCMYVCACMHEGVRVHVCVCVCVCVYVCVCTSGCKWKIVGSIPSMATLELLLFPWVENLLTLFQSTQLYKWGPDVN